MPEISRFLGIIISMYFDEHNPPHFHVNYNEHRATIEIKTLNLMAGSIPARVRGLVEEWGNYIRMNCCKCGKLPAFIGLIR